MLVPHAAEGLLDGLGLVQQRFGDEGRFEQDGAVEERRLVEVSPRGRLIKRGRGQEARPREPREAPDGFAERRCSAAEIGADGEADIHAFCSPWARRIVTAASWKSPGIGAAGLCTVTSTARTSE